MDLLETSRKVVFSERYSHLPAGLAVGGLSLDAVRRVGHHARMKNTLRSLLRKELERIEDELLKLGQKRRSPEQRQRMSVLKRYRRGLRMILTKKSA